MKSLAERHNEDVSVEILLAPVGLIVNVVGRNGVVHMHHVHSGKLAMDIFYHPFCYVDPAECYDKPNTVAQRVREYT